MRSQDKKVVPDRSNYVPIWACWTDDVVGYADAAEAKFLRTLRCATYGI
jgi:hypothetical protein